MATDSEQLILSISADTAQIRRALARLPADAKTAAQGVEQAFSRTDPVGRMQQNLGRSMKAVQNDAKNLSFQISDIATGLSTGQSPFMIMNQQMGQVTQILGGQGLTGALLILKTALASSWPMLALIGISSLASAAIEYFTTSEKEAKEATKEAEAHTKALQSQLEVINRLREAQGLKPVEQGKDALALFIAQRDAMRTNVEIAGQLADKLNEISDAILSVPADTFEGQTATIHELDAALRDLEAGIAAGNVDFLAFAKIMQEIEKRGNLPEDIQKLVSEIADLAAKGALSARNLKDLRAAMDGTAKAAERAAEAAKKFNDNLEKMGKIAAAQVDDVKALLEAYQAAVKAAQSMGEVMAANEAFAAGMSRITVSGPTAEFIKREEAGGGFTPKAYWDVNAYRVGYGSDTYVDAMNRVQKVTKDTVVTLEQANADLARRIPEFQATIQRQIGPEFWRSFTEDQQTALTSIAYNYGQLPDSIVRAIQTGDKGRVATAIAALPANPERRQREAQLFAGAGGRAADALKAADAEKTLAEKRAEANVKLQEMIVTEQQEVALKEKINAINADVSLSETQRAAAITLATAEAAKAAEVEKLVNQAKEAGLTITPALIASYQALAQAKVNAIIADQQIAVANKQAAEAEKQRTDALKQLNQQAQQMVSGAITGFIQDLRNGVDAGEAFNNMLNRIIDSLIQMAVQMAVKSLFNPAGGGGFLSNLFGVAHSGGIVGQTAFPQRRVDPRVFIGARRMAGGGLVGGEVPIIAHRGEMVIPKSMVGRGTPMQQINTSLGDVNVDMSGTGMVAANSDAARQFGQNVQKLIQAEIVVQSRPGGLLRKVPA